MNNVNIIRKHKCAMGSNCKKIFSVKVTVINPGPDTIAGKIVYEKVVTFLCVQMRCHFLFVRGHSKVTSGRKSYLSHFRPILNKMSSAKEILLCPISWSFSSHQGLEQSFLQIFLLQVFENQDLEFFPAQVNYKFDSCSKTKIFK